MKLIIKKKVLIWLTVGALIIIGLVIGLIFAYKNGAPPTLKGAVVANGIECANIGRSILEQDGSAVDAAIATLFCEGVTCPQSMGIGGGFLATIYTRSSLTVETLVAREAAPLKATRDMFVNKTIEGGLAVAVPGEIRGYWHLHQKYGKLPWKKLVQPTIDLCRNGHLVTKYLHASIKKKEKLIRKEPTMAEIFINQETGEAWNAGDRIKRPKLAETLEIIAEHGQNAMYDGGEIGKRLARDIQNFGGIITEQDFMEYEVRWNKPVVAKMKGYTLYSAPLPGSGVVLAFIMNLINGLMTDDRNLLWHRLIESFKHGYGQRTQLGDIQFEPSIKELVSNMTNPEFAAYIRTLIHDDRTFQDFKYYGANFSNVADHGTANMAVLAPNGDAITVTSTINNIFGAMIRSRSTGIILNDEMDDFSTPGITNGFDIPPSPSNFIKPKKMPISSMCPSIILNDKGDVQLIIGSAGGSKITTSVALTIIRYLLLDENLHDAVQNKRFHHQLAPMKVQHEQGMDSEFLNYLTKIGHVLQEVPPESGFSAMTAIGTKGDEPMPVFDNRRNGSAAVTILKPNST